MLHLQISLASNKYCYTYCVEIKYTYSQQTLTISRKRNIWVNENDIITAQAVWKQRICRFYEIFAWQVATFFKVNIIILLILIHMYIYIIRISLYLPLSMRMNIKKTTCRQVSLTFFSLLHAECGILKLNINIYCTYLHISIWASICALFASSSNSLLIA